jgi:hypothetical protein
MRTVLNVEGADCPICFGETIDALSRIEGVRAVRGSIAGPCIEIDHDDAEVDVLASTVRDRLHGVAMFANEVDMVPIELAVDSAPCVHRPSGRDRHV